MLYIFSLFVALSAWSQGVDESDSKSQAPVEGEIKNEILEKRDKFQFLQKKGDLDILRHKPIYFAYNNPLTKVQFSFKSPIIEDIPFYFAYSQIIFWKLGAESKPFLDATYNPEFFYRFKFDESKNYSVDLGVWEHSSNGKDGAASRSYDQTYARINYYIELKSWIVVLSGKFRYIYNVDETNKDILDYAGPAEFEFRFIQLFDGWVDKGELILNVNPGGKFSDRFDKGGMQVGYNFRLGGLKVVPAFYLQYYVGFGETLINYNQRVEAFRVGLLF